MAKEPARASRNEPPVTLLFIEGQETPTGPIAAILERCGLRAEWRPSGADLEGRDPDRVVLVVRHRPPALDGATRLEETRQRGDDTPCIVLVEDATAEEGATWIRRGAWDVVRESDIERFGPSVVMALRARAATAVARTAEELVLETQREAFEQLRRLSLRVAEAREAERARLARQVHDDVGQSLTVLKLDVTWIQRRLPDERDDLRKRTQAVLGTIDTTIDHVRAIAQNLRPAILDEAGLAAAVGWAVREFGQRWGIKCVFEGSRDVSLTGSTSTAMFRALQEALDNVARHANATQVEVSLDEADGIVEMTVFDNGCGLAATGVVASTGVGLAQIREIAASLGGWAEIESPTIGGTAIRITVPSEAPNPSPGERTRSPNR